MDNTDSLLEVGLGFTADWTKTGGFEGREAVGRQKSEAQERGGVREGLGCIIDEIHTKRDFTPIFLTF